MTTSNGDDIPRLRYTACVERSISPTVDSIPDRAPRRKVLLGAQDLDIFVFLWTVNRSRLGELARTGWLMDDEVSLCRILSSEMNLGCKEAELTVLIPCNAARFEMFPIVLCHRIADRYTQADDTNQGDRGYITKYTILELAMLLTCRTSTVAISSAMLE